MNKQLILLYALGLGTLFGSASVAYAQTYSTGQSVFASPSGASNDWYSGCVVGTGRSNNSYQVECAGTTWWISSANIRTTAPTAGPDPMRPGQMQTLVITPSHPQVSARANAPTTRAGMTQVTTSSADQPGPGNFASGVHRQIEQDKIDARSAKFSVGKYECRSNGQYTFSDLYITGPTSYRVDPGGGGAFTSSGVGITFTSGPYTGAYAQMMDGRTVGISADGTKNLATQCHRVN